MALLLEGLLTADQASRLAAELADAPFSDGRQTAHGSARQAKHNEQLTLDHPLSVRLGTTILEALAHSAPFTSVAVPHTILPMRFARYRVGMGYGEHLDLPVVATPAGPLRTDLSVTVWLIPPDSYDGGELILATDGGEQVYKGNAGDAVVYPSGTLHRVAPVTRGERLVAISWLQSLIADAEAREVLFQLVEVATELAKDERYAAQVTALHQLHHRLMRRWVVC